MTQTLTETFCERCGTRYEFSAPTRLNPLRKTRGLIGGLKNYLTSQDALGDALDDAMRNEEGARFPPDMMGSLVYVGGLPLESALGRASCHPKG